MIDTNIVKVRVKGDFACFTQPALKVERMTYACMTPSAARGILECILYKPEFQWIVEKIKILKPVNFTSFKRNEIKKIQGENPIDIVEVDPRGKPINRVQRNSVVLRDVEYIIEARIYMSEANIKKVKDRDRQMGNKPCEPIVKYRDMFTRRVKKGQCWHQPYLGTREFSCEFFPVSTDDEKRADDLDLTYPIGSMLFDIFYDDKFNATPLYMYNVVVEHSELICDKELGTKLLSSSHFAPKMDERINQVLFEFNLKEEREVN